jgi:glycosyltransferase involved in cell wall biosynthesis
MITKLVYPQHKKAGGMEIHVKDLVGELVKRGHDITIITSSHPSGIKEENMGNVQIYFTKTSIFPNPISRIKYFKESAEIIRDIEKSKKFDIIHGQSDMGYGYLKFNKMRTPFVSTTHGTTISELISSFRTDIWTIPYRILLFPFYYNIEKFVFQKSDKIICVSPQLKEEINKIYHIPDKKLITIVNGLNLEKFKSTDRIINIKKKGEKIILSSGMIQKQKGFDLLIKTFSEIIKKNKKLKLLIIGDGPYLNKLKKLTRKLRIQNQVIFTGRIINDEMPLYYNMADIFVFPTIRVEGLPYVLLEAMACNLPVISSRIGGIPSIIKHNKTGLLIEPGNMKQLENNILLLLNNKRLANKIKDNAKKMIIQKYNLNTTVNKNIETYKLAISQWKRKVVFND